jgi:hypothetical protein
LEEKVQVCPEIGDPQEMDGGICPNMLGSICIYIYGGFHKWGHPKMVGLFHGKSHL